MKSILSKLWLSITSLVIIILLIIWLFQIGLLNNFYINERTNILLEEGEKIASLFLESNDYTKVSQNIMDEINSFESSLLSTRVFIMDSKSNILFNTTIMQEKLLKDLHISNESSSNQNISKNLVRTRNIDIFFNDSDVLASISKGESFSKQKNQPESNRSFIIAGIPIKENEKIIGAVLLSSPIEPIKETTLILKKQLSIITFVSLIIGTLLALWLAKIFTKPILKIIKTSNKIATGDFSVNIRLNSKDEIGVLGHTINNMALQLGQIENFRKEFISNVSHELKTPISLIRAYAELVMDIDDIENKNEYLQVVIDESDRLNKMVEDILYLSQMEAGYSKPDFTEFPIISIIESVIEKLNFFASEKNISLSLKIDYENALVYADEYKMYQVFFNLINNAINHSYENSKILIKITNTKDIIKVQVIDNGRGIPKEDLPYIWDRFYKVDKSRKRNSSSTGLGMSIVKNILEIHEFKYGIESELNKGTLVWIEINKRDE